MELIDSDGAHDFAMGYFINTKAASKSCEHEMECFTKSELVLNAFLFVDLKFDIED